jgi:hypothetical protein
MADTFDKAYARYLSSLAKLDALEDITDKNRLFRELTAQLSEMENNLKMKTSALDPAESLNEAPLSDPWS